MADQRPPLPSVSSYNSRGEGLGDPFADRPRQTQFSEPPHPYHGAPQGYESSATLPQEFGAQGNYDDDEYLEKQPLNANPSFAGGFYPPGYVL